MELTLESAFSPGGLLGNASYVLLIWSMAMRNMFWLRCLAILSGLTGIAYDAIWLHDPVGTFWESCFTLTNIVQWLILVNQERKLKLTAEEVSLWKKYFSDLDARECKQLLAKSTQISGKSGDVIISQGEIVDRIYVMLSGKMEIKLHGEKVAECSGGDLLGEMSFLSGAPASADSVCATDCELLAVNQEGLASLLRSSPETGNAINAYISRNLIQKIVRQNEKDLIPQ